jgi:hypothetical protein
VPNGPTLHVYDDDKNNQILGKDSNCKIKLHFFEETEINQESLL